MDIHGRLARWSGIIAEDALQIQRIDGRSNALADCLSRSVGPEEGNDEQEVEVGIEDFL